MVFSRLIACVVLAATLSGWLTSPSHAIILGPSELGTSSVETGLPSEWSDFSVQRPIAERFDHGGMEPLRRALPMILADTDQSDGFADYSRVVSQDTLSSYKIRYYQPSGTGSRDVLLLELSFKMLKQLPEDMSLYIPLIRITDEQGRKNYYTTFMSQTLLDAWINSPDGTGEAGRAFLNSSIKVEPGAVSVADKNQLDIVARILSELPMDALAKLSVTPRKKPSTRSSDDTGTLGAWKLDRKLGNPRAYIVSTKADPRGEMALYAVCWNGEFVLAMDNKYEGHRYFDFEDFVPEGGMDITPVVLLFDGSDRDFLFWHRPEAGEINSPNTFLRKWSGMNRGEMYLSGRGDFSMFNTDWDAREIFRKVVSAKLLGLTTWGIPRDKYSAWFRPNASLAKLTKHLSCF